MFEFILHNFGWINAHGGEIIVACVIIGAAREIFNAFSR